MGKYKYRAMKNDGSKINADCEASSRDEVLSMITANGYYPLKIEEIIESKNIEFTFMERIKIKDLSIFCRQMYTMLDAGVPITNALALLSEQMNNKKFKKIIEEMDEDVKKGEMFSSSMKKHPKVFPQLLISMIESGEVSGNLDEMMLRMSTHFEKEAKIANKVKGAMIYPAVLSVVAIAAVMIIMVVVMPTFLEMFTSSGVELPISTKILMGMSSFLSKNIILVVVFIVGSIVGFNFYKQTEGGIRNISILKLKIPVIKELNKKIIVSRFTRTLSTLLSSGVPMVQSLPIVSGVLGNKIAEEAMEKIRERVMRGDGLSGPIKEYSIFPPMLSSMIKIGEESGALDDILNKTADFYDEEVEQAIQTTTALLEPALIVVMGAVIGFIIISIMTPMFDMYGQI